MSQSPAPFAFAPRPQNFLVTVARMAGILQSPSPLDAKLKQISQMLQQALDAEFVWIGLTQDKGQAIVGRSAIAPTNPAILHNLRPLQLGSLEETLVVKRRLQQISDIQRDTRCRDWWEVAKEWQLHGTVAFPIMSQQRVLGVGLLGCTRWGLVLNPEEEEGIQLLSGLLGAAIANDEGSARRQEELTAPLLSMADRLRQACDTETMLQAVVDELHAQLNPTRTVIYWLADSREFEVRAIAQSSSIYYVPPLGMRVAVKDINGLHQQLAQDRTIAIPDVVLDHRGMLAKVFVQKLQLQALLAHPIIFQNKLLGYLCFEQCNQTRIWSDPEQRLIQGMANLISVTATPAKLYEMERRRFLEQMLINRIVQDIRNSLDPNEVMRAAVDRLGQGLDVDRCLLINYDAYGAELRVVHQFCKPGIPPLSTNLPWPEAEADRLAITSATPVAVEDIATDFRFITWRDVLESGSTRSLMLCGLAHQGQPNGVLFLHRCFVPQPWTEEEREICLAVADQVGIALGQAVLFQQTQEQAELETKLNRATRAVRSESAEQELFSQVTRELTLALKARRCICAAKKNGQWVVIAHHSRELSLTRPQLDLTPHTLLLEYLLQSDEVLALNGPLEGLGEGEFSSLAGRIPVNQEIEAVLLILDDEGRRWRGVAKQFMKQLMQEALLAFAQGVAFTRLQQLSRQLKDLNEYRNNMVSIASHEMRTPMTSISLFVETMLMDRELVTEEDLEQMQTECNRMTNLLNNLATLVNLEGNTTQFTYRDVVVSELIARVFRRVDAIAQKQQAVITLDDRVQDFVLNTDEQKLETVLYALLENACKHTPSGVHILFGVDMTDTKITFTVTDNGQGIPAEKLSLLFQPFIRVEDVMNHSKGGAGLGLAISKEIIEKMKGKVYVSSQVGKGTTFTVELPCTP